MHPSFALKAILNKQKSFAEQNLRSYFAVVSLGYVKYAIIALLSTKLHLACRKEGKQAAFWNMTLWWSLAPICSRYCLDKEKVVFNCIACVFSIFPLDDLNTSPFSSTVMSAIHFPLIIKQCLHALMLRPRYGEAPLAVCLHLIFQQMIDNAISTPTLLLIFAASIKLISFLVHSSIDLTFRGEEKKCCKLR